MLQSKACTLFLSVFSRILRCITSAASFQRWSTCGDWTHSIWASQASGNDNMVLGNASHTTSQTNQLMYQLRTLGFQLFLVEWNMHMFHFLLSMVSHKMYNVPCLPVELKHAVGSGLLCLSESNLLSAILSVWFSFMLSMVGFTDGGIAWLEASEL